MKIPLYALLVIFVGVASVALSEVFVVTWLQHVTFDATGDFFWTALLPAQWFLVGLTTLLLFKIYAFRPLLFMPLYLLTYMATHAFELNSFFNPVGDILRYLVAIGIAAAFWFACLWQFYLKKRQAAASM